MTNDYVLTPFRTDHVMGVECTEVGVNIPFLTQAQKQPCWSLFHEDRLIIAGGFIMAAPWLAQAWLICTHEASNHIRASVRTIRTAISVVTNLGVGRIQAVCSVNTPHAERLLKLVGFKFEAVMPLYGKYGEDYMQYVILNGGPK